MSLEGMLSSAEIIGRVGSMINTIPVASYRYLSLDPGVNLLSMRINQFNLSGRSSNKYGYQARIIHPSSEIGLL